MARRSESEATRHQMIPACRCILSHRKAAAGAHIRACGSCCLERRPAPPFRAAERFSKLTSLSVAVPTMLRSTLLYVPLVLLLATVAVARMPGFVRPQEGDVVDTLARRFEARTPSSAEVTEGHDPSYFVRRRAANTVFHFTTRNPSGGPCVKNGKINRATKKKRDNGGSGSSEPEPGQGDTGRGKKPPRKRTKVASSAVLIRKDDSKNSGPTPGQGDTGRKKKPPKRRAGVTSSAVMVRKVDNKAPNPQNDNNGNGNKKPESAERCPWCPSKRYSAAFGALFSRTPKADNGGKLDGDVFVRRGRGKEDDPGVSDNPDNGKPPEECPTCPTKRMEAPTGVFAPRAIDSSIEDHRLLDGRHDSSGLDKSDDLFVARAPDVPLLTGGSVETFGTRDHSSAKPAAINGLSRRKNFRFDESIKGYNKTPTTKRATSVDTAAAL